MLDDYAVIDSIAIEAINQKVYKFPKITRDSLLKVGIIDQLTIRLENNDSLRSEYMHRLQSIDYTYDTIVPYYRYHYEQARAESKYVSSFLKNWIAQAQIEKIWYFNAECKWLAKLALEHKLHIFTKDEKKSIVAHAMSRLLAEKLQQDSVLLEEIKLALATKSHK